MSCSWDEDCEVCGPRALRNPFAMWMAILLSIVGLSLLHGCGHGGAGPVYCPTNGVVSTGSSTSGGQCKPAR
jgi:hypothetical protein